MGFKRVTIPFSTSPNKRTRRASPPADPPVTADKAIQTDPVAEPTPPPALEIGSYADREDILESIASLAYSRVENIEKDLANRQKQHEKNYRGGNWEPKAMLRDIRQLRDHRSEMSDWAMKLLEVAKEVFYVAQVELRNVSACPAISDMLDEQEKRVREMLVERGEGEWFAELLGEEEEERRRKFKDENGFSDEDVEEEIDRKRESGACSGSLDAAKEADDQEKPEESEEKCEDGVDETQACSESSDEC